MVTTRPAARPRRIASTAKVRYSLIRNDAGDVSKLPCLPTKAKRAGTKAMARPPKGATPFNAPAGLDVVGTRVACYWKNVNEWYVGTITAYKPHAKLNMLIEYEDGDEEWVGLPDPTIMKMAPAPPPKGATPVNAPAGLDDVGTRVACYWKNMNEWYVGTITAYKPHAKLNMLIEYEDGDEEWVGLPDPTIVKVASPKGGY